MDTHFGYNAWLHLFQSCELLLQVLQQHPVVVRASSRWTNRNPKNKGNYITTIRFKRDSLMRLG